MKKIYSLLILSFVLLNLCACSYQAPKQSPEVLLDLPSLLSTSENASIDKAKQQIKEAYDKGYIIGYDTHLESGENYKEYTDDRGHLQLNGCSSLAVCIPCKEGSYSLDELKDLLRRYGMKQPFNERTTVCEYAPGFHSGKKPDLLPEQLGDEFEILCTDRVADEILKYSYDNNLSVEEESAFYTQGAAYKYSAQKKGSFLFITLNTHFEGPPASFQFMGCDEPYFFSSKGVKGFKDSLDQDFMIFDM